MLKQFLGKRPQGIALISVLLISLVVSMLAVSMLSITRSSKFAHLQQENWSRAMDACYSGLDFAKSRLKQDKGWGTTVFTGVGNLSNPDLVVTERGTLVSGQQPELNQAFQLEVANNLSGFASSPSPAWSRSKIELPPHTALVRVTGTSGGAKKSIEVLLSKAQFSQNSIFAGKDVYFNTQTTILRSTLPRGNRARAVRNIYLNNPSEFDFAPGNPGKLQAGVDTIIKNSGASVDANSEVTAVGPASRSLVDNPNLIRQTSVEIHGMVELNTPPAPPVFNKDKLASPATSALTIRPGNYKFVAPNQVKAPDGSIQVDKIFSTDGNPAVYLRDFQFKPQGYVKVDGNISISAEMTKLEYNSDTGTTTTVKAEVPATLAMGYDDLGFPTTKDPTATAPTSPSDHRLEVTGDLTVKGDLAGSGQVVVNKVDATTGGSFSVYGNSYMSATRTTQMAVTAQKRVQISNVSDDAALQPFAMHQSDVKVFKLVGSTIAPASTNGGTLDNLTSASRVKLRDLAGSDDNPDNTASTIRQTVVPNYSTGILSQLFTSAGGAQTIPGNSNILPEDAVLIKKFVKDAEDAGGMTIGKHLRLREFLKSIERNYPERYFIDPNIAGDPIRGIPGYSDADGRIQAAAINQVFTLNQDARTRGLNLRTHLQGVNANQYGEGLRKLTVFGGLLHSEGSIDLAASGGLSLIGVVLTSVGSIHIKSPSSIATRITYDPSSFEDHLDQSGGFSTLFFWSND